VAVVYFDSEQDVTQAVAMKNGFDINGQIIKVRSGLYNDNL